MLFCQPPLSRARKWPSRPVTTTFSRTGTPPMRRSCFLVKNRGARVSTVCVKCLCGSSPAEPLSPPSRVHKTRKCA